jgi:hypothetical protein
MPPSDKRPAFAPPGPPDTNAEGGELEKWGRYDSKELSVMDPAAAAGAEEAAADEDEDGKAPNCCECCCWWRLLGSECIGAEKVSTDARYEPPTAAVAIAVAIAGVVAVAVAGVVAVVVGVNADVAGTSASAAVGEVRTCCMCCCGGGGSSGGKGSCGSKLVPVNPGSTCEFQGPPTKCGGGPENLADNSGPGA